MRTRCIKILHAEQVDISCNKQRLTIRETLFSFVSTPSHRYDTCRNHFSLFHNLSGPSIKHQKEIKRQCCSFSTTVFMQQTPTMRPTNDTVLSVNPVRAHDCSVKLVFNYFIIHEKPCENCVSISHLIPLFSRHKEVPYSPHTQGHR